MTVSNIVSICLAHFNDYCGLHKTLSKILCKWQQNSVVSFFWGRKLNCVKAGFAR